VPYPRELEAALAAAREAGALLRQEFHRPGGPRGTRHHADADTEAERVIHARLNAAFPEFGYYGEELGAMNPPRDGTPSWLVDPNDGTSAFTAGYRGAAVSIGLVHNGLPVLGVVFAYAAPDDSGDLFTWAEGCGPVQRNGRPVDRRWPEELSAGRTVLLAHPADRKPVANARTVQPMRFRGLPSIAYRLALGAAGEADATVSILFPNDWDYAAGHALLRGAGGDLYNNSARPVRYSNTGRGFNKGSIFAGALGIVSHLARRDWNSLLERPAEGDPFCRPPNPGENISDAGLLSRAQGCLLGQFAGDSLGSLVEFQSPPEIASKYPGGVRLLADGGPFDTIAGQPTDDSEMALALARMIVHEEIYVSESALRAYRNWHDSHPFDIGSTTRAGLEGRPNRRSEANGALMRVSPLGIASARLEPGRGAAWARDDARLTHPNPVCADANGAFVAALARAIGMGEEPEQIYEAALREAGEPAVQRALASAKEGPPADYLSRQGWVLIALQNAFYQLLHASSLEAGVVDTVMRGGDTDTNAAIAGALLGAVHGRQAIPAQWMDRVLTCRPVEGLAGVARPRPAKYWPIDALYLAERLLLGE
jgi:ADP-ribosylglycohydrolase/fructose-1,6-bisphosphatase/inositol monophosphatase family enzyme